MVLLDDAADVRLLAEVVLGDMGGWQVSAAATPAEAEALLRQGRVDVIVVDLILDGDDGLAWLARMRAAGVAADVPAVLLTGRPDAVDRDRAAELGVCGVIGKPVDPLHFSDQVAAATGRA